MTLQGNRIKQVNTPTFSEFFKSYPNSIIQASGEFVDLLKCQMGNSEVGHLNIGVQEKCLCWFIIDQ